MTKTPKLPDIPEEERSPLVVKLLEIIRYLLEVLQALRDEVAVLKGNKPKPKIRPGKMEKESEDNQDKKSSDGKRPGSKKKKKTGQLEIHETIPIAAENIPEGSKFKGYKEFIVQGLIIKAHNIRYRMQRWQPPDGGYVSRKLPPTVRGHFSPEMISYILYQYYQCHVTQPLLLEQLHEFGVDISSGQVTISFK